MEIVGVHARACVLGLNRASHGSLVNYRGR